MDNGIIDQQGFRHNVGMVIVSRDGQLFWGRRAGQARAWQFPQGGIAVGEEPDEALYRELYEELGLHQQDVVCLGETKDWVSYELPAKFRRRSQPRCIGQRQKWFLLRLEDEKRISLTRSGKPEFDRWRWVDYWYPIEHVINFKKKVYHTVLTEFEALLNVC